MENPDNIIGISFNENATDLICQTTGRDVKRCTVPKSHYNGLKNGYYFTKHQNLLGGKSNNYEVPPVKVILNDSPIFVNGNFSSFILYLWLLLIFVLF